MWFDSGLNPTAYTFWVCNSMSIKVASIQSNILNFSTGKKYSTEILMAFVSYFFWRKSLILQLSSLKLFIFHVNFLMADSDDNNLCFESGISL